MNVLVYTGPEVVQTSLGGTLSTLRSLLLLHYPVQTISLQALLSQPWSATCALLVFPECRSTFTSSSSLTIKTYVEAGGSFLGFGTGAKYSTSRGLEPGGFTLGAASLSKDHPLRFFDKSTGSYINPTSRSAGKEIVSRSITLHVPDGDIVNGIYEARENELSGFDGRKNVSILARYSDRGVDGPITAVKCDVGGGRVALWAPSVEYPLTEEPASSSLTPLALTPQDVILSEKSRCSLVRQTLLELGLRLPVAEVQQERRPLPQFLTSHPLKPTVVSRIVDALAAPSPGSQLSIIEDSNDTFHFHPLRESPELLDKIRNDIHSSSDPSTWQPKHVIICPNGEIPDREQTPLFDIRMYYQALSDARTKEGISTSAGPWGLGEALLYGEMVTSTQTLIEKNTRFLSALPVPIVSIASYQLTGRGRGTNGWTSPFGCLQFSILYRISSSSFPTSKIVFVQYLFALAVVEACRDESVLGKHGDRIRLKWPNDIYAIVGPGEGEKTKIGGVLVNTSFSGGRIEILIGCGVNVLNPPPFTSLSQLLSPDQNHDLNLEKTVAIILAKFEGMWATFLKERGSFKSFMDLYLKRWLHSDQLVTLTTTVPPTRVRIVGITADHGLLRTLPERSGWSSGEEGFIDLQPDGNSFDIMAGLIKSKS